jgi:hypothetical protein
MAQHSGSLFPGLPLLLRMDGGGLTCKSMASIVASVVD